MMKDTDCSTLAACHAASLPNQTISPGSDKLGKSNKDMEAMNATDNNRRKIMNANITVTALLEAEGLGPWMSYTGFAAAVWLAEAVSGTIVGPIRRAGFVAEAASSLEKMGPQPFEMLEGNAAYLAGVAEEATPTPCGSQELWGSLLEQAQTAV